MQLPLHLYPGRQVITWSPVYLEHDPVGNMSVKMTILPLSAAPLSARQIMTLSKLIHN